MNELCELLKNIKNDTEIVLEKDRTYDVRQDDSFELQGYY